MLKLLNFTISDLTAYNIKKATSHKITNEREVKKVQYMSSYQLKNH
jgi:hypothetical protein